MRMKLKSVLEENATVCLESDDENSAGEDRYVCRLQIDDYSEDEHTGVIVALLPEEARAIGKALCRWSEAEDKLRGYRDTVALISRATDRVVQEAQALVARQAVTPMQQGPPPDMPFSAKVNLICGLLTDEEREIVEARLGGPLEALGAEPPEPPEGDAG
jgi:hypothetical protein